MTISLEKKSESKKVIWKQNFDERLGCFLTGSQYSAGYQQYYQQQTGYQASQQQTGNQAAGGYQSTQPQTGNQAAGGYQSTQPQTGNQATGGYQSNVPGATPSGGQSQQQPSQTGQARQQSATQYPASYYQGKIKRQIWPCNSYTEY